MMCINYCWKASSEHLRVLAASSLRMTGSDAPSPASSPLETCKKNPKKSCWAVELICFHNMLVAQTSAGSRLICVAPRMTGRKHYLWSRSEDRTWSDLIHETGSTRCSSGILEIFEVFTQTLVTTIFVILVKKLQFCLTIIISFITFKF